MNNNKVNIENTYNSSNENININNNNDSLKYINKIYDNLTYFDLYGNSVIIFVLVTIVVSVVFLYCRVMKSSSTIASNWPSERCKPQNMLFAGWITRPPNKSAIEYTSENFQYCVQNILKTVSSDALKPYNYMVSALHNIFNGMSKAIQYVRMMINKLRNNFKNFTQNVLSRILNILIPIQKIFIALMDTFLKIQGTMTAGLYTTLGAYYTLQTLMGAILELIIKILVALSIIIVGLWIMPFTWPAAASMSAVFLGISIPLGIIVYFMSDVLHIKTSGIPKLRCFDENTMISLKNSKKSIKDVSVGDKLLDGSYITAKIIVDAKNMKIFKLNNVLVSESHLVYYNDKWIRVKEHPNAILMDGYSPEFLYCLNTSNKIIEIENNIFSDWDEIQINNIDALTNQQIENIHECLDYGYEESTCICLLNNDTKQIDEVKIGDVLYNGSIVYGLVEIETKNLRKLRDNYKNKINSKLYHLLTNDGNLYIDLVNVKDYNNVIDKFII